MSATLQQALHPMIARRRRMAIVGTALRMTWVGLALAAGMGVWDADANWTDAGRRTASVFLLATLGAWLALILRLWRRPVPGTAVIDEAYRVQQVTRDDHHAVVSAAWLTRQPAESYLTRSLADRAQNLGTAQAIAVRPSAVVGGSGLRFDALMLGLAAGAIVVSFTIAPTFWLHEISRYGSAWKSLALPPKEQGPASAAKNPNDPPPSSGGGSDTQPAATDATAMAYVQDFADQAQRLALLAEKQGEQGTADDPMTDDRTLSQLEELEARRLSAIEAAQAMASALNQPMSAGLAAALAELRNAQPLALPRTSGKPSASADNLRQWARSIRDAARHDANLAATASRAGRQAMSGGGEGTGRQSGTSTGSATDGSTGSDPARSGTSVENPGNGQNVYTSSASARGAPPAYRAIVADYFDRISKDDPPLGPRETP